MTDNARQWMLDRLDRDGSFLVWPTGGDGPNAQALRELVDEGIAVIEDASLEQETRLRVKRKRDDHDG